MQQLGGMGPGVVTVGAAVDSAECWPGSREGVMLWGPVCEPGGRTKGIALGDSSGLGRGLGSLVSRHL